MKLYVVLYLHVLSLIVFDTISIYGALSMSKTGCQERCGDIMIPYPFGIGPQCSGNSSFVIVCKNFTTPILSSINKEILDISITGSIVIKQDTSLMECSNTQLSKGRVPLSLWGSPFTISGRYNTLAVVGCKNSVWLYANETTTLEGCGPLCDANSTDSSCNGINCCQMIVPPRLKEIEYMFKTNILLYENTSFCGRIFGVEKKWLKNYKSYKGLVRGGFDKDFEFAPLVLEWEFGDVKDNSFGFCTYSDDDCLTNPDKDLKDTEACILKFIHDRCRLHPSEFCNSPYNYVASVPRKNMTFLDYHDNKDGYVSTVRYCSCNQGYQGNPYLPQGCIDIDECNTQSHDPCAMMHLSCTNTNGSYQCVDRKAKFRSHLRIIFISIGSGLGTLGLLLVTWWSTRAIRKVIEVKRRHKFFKRNGGLLLKQQLSSTANGLEITKLYTSEELTIATNQYNEDQILGSGGQGTVYKGILKDGKIVAVKKSEKVDKDGIQQFINELCILSQVNHRNVVKLLGCCLETKVPLLVYEYIPNGTLYQHIHHPNEEFRLPWEIRVRIAREVAASLAYLHSASSAPIYHRDIKSQNILLDVNYNAKVSDFGTSRSVAIDQTHVTTRVWGTYGYMDPEYMISNKFTEKSDVYSFSVVMAELLTGRKALEGEISLAQCFLACMEEDQLFNMVDSNIIREGDREEIIAFARLAKRCMQLNGRSRPTMKSVAAELEEVGRSSCDSTEVIEPDDLSLMRAEFNNMSSLGKSITKLEGIQEEEYVECDSSEP